jgi:acyl carrier protein
VSSISRSEVRNALIAALANVDGDDPAETERRVSALGDADYELDSKVAECVIAEVGEAFGVELPAPADLRAHQYASVGALLDLMQKRLEEED